MKKTLVVLSMIAGTVGVYGQGEIAWQDGQSGYDIAIISPNPANPSVEQTGQTSWDLPSGSATYGGGWIGGGAAPGGGVGATTTFMGVNYTQNANFEVGVYLDSSPSAVMSDITTGSPLATTGIESGGNAGLYGNGATLTATDPNSTSSAYVGIAAWYTGGGSVPSYAAAVAAHDPAGYVVSTSAAPVGAAPSPAGNLQGGYGLTSFSLATQAIPEPSTIALGIMGASALMLRLRRRS